VISIDDPTERVGFMTTRSLQPEPIPLDVKIILIGQPSTYQLLEAYDEDFGELFKVKADFDTSMPWKDEGVDGYVEFVRHMVQDEGLKHVDCSGLARTIEYGARLAEDQQKLSTRFSEIADILREANYYATTESSAYITAVQVEKAIEEKIYRSNLMQEKIQEMMKRGTLMIDVQGERVGQVNGLAVLSLGDISFGSPNRITASIGVGREGLVNIEREANLSGPIHTKGVMILAGFLMDRFAQDKPISLGARIVFEQSYNGIEGDSASSTELYALLSALSGCAITQSIAVTGSVNQKGEIQPIGGVNEKVEGFYEVCKARGLTSEQGVMVPSLNLDNLMLKQEIVDAVRAGQFHIWSVSTIDEGIQVLTGIPGGKRLQNGRFEDGSINARVDQKLRELAEILVKFGEDGKGEKRTAKALS
jgi:predicted ATP-dependent protease